MAIKRVIATVCITSTRLGFQNGSITPYSDFSTVAGQSIISLGVQTKEGIGRFADGIPENHLAATTYKGLGEPNGGFLGNTTYHATTTFTKQDSENNVGGPYVNGTIGGSSLRMYFEGASFQTGMRYKKTGTHRKERKINNFGITFGLPIMDSFSNLDLDFEGDREKADYADLIEKNYFKISLSLSLNDIWFRKRRIN